ncbi:hypothetical protein MNV49_004436 [Pseudohyphozyma bogoriensis]|nr:hypothetical protein MNV49_004436 [Pseudohyphozyma bogoriensis]
MTVLPPPPPPYSPDATTPGTPPPPAFSSLSSANVDLEKGESTYPADEKLSLHEVLAADEGGEGELKNVAMDVTFPAGVSPEQVHALMFTDREFLTEFLTATEEVKELELGEWDGGERKSHYIKPIHASIGPKETLCEIVEKDEATSFSPVGGADVFTTDSEARTPNVPSGDAFVNKTHTVITASEGDGLTRLRVTTEVEWVKWSMIKGIIERSSLDGAKQYHVDILQAIHAKLGLPPPDLSAVVSTSLPASTTGDRLATRRCARAIMLRAVLITAGVYALLSFVDAGMSVGKEMVASHGQGFGLGGVGIGEFMRKQVEDTRLLDVDTTAVTAQSVKDEESWLDWLKKEVSEAEEVGAKWRESAKDAVEHGWKDGEKLWSKAKDEVEVAGNKLETLPTPSATPSVDAGVVVPRAQGLAMEEFVNKVSRELSSLMDGPSGFEFFHGVSRDWVHSLEPRWVQFTTAQPSDNWDSVLDRITRLRKRDYILPDSFATTQILRRTWEIAEWKCDLSLIEAMPIGGAAGAPWNEISDRRTRWRLKRKQDWAKAYNKRRTLMEDFEPIQDGTGCMNDFVYALVAIVVNASHAFDTAYAGHLVENCTRRQGLRHTPLDDE